MKFNYFILILILLIGFTSAFSGAGAGTSGDPYQITNWGQLQEMNSALSSYYKLMNDLNSSTLDYNTYASSSANSGAGWNPIGEKNAYGFRFRGNFNGQNYTISDLYIYRPSSSWGGLFGFIGTEGTGSVYDLVLKDINVTSGGLSGIVLGEGNRGFYLRNVHVKGDNYIRCSGGGCGGLVGYTREDLSTMVNIDGCSVKANVYGTSTVGGVIGYAYDGTRIYNSFFEGYIEANGGAIGGFVGRVRGNNNAERFTYLEKNYAKGILNYTGTGGYVGGFAGGGNDHRVYFYDNYASIDIYTDSLDGSIGGFFGHLYRNTIWRCFSTGYVGAVNGGGFAGTHVDIHPNYGGGSGYNYWDTQTSGKSNAANTTSSQYNNINAVGKTTAQMYTKSTYQTYNIQDYDSWTTETWKILAGSSYAMLWFESYPIIETGDYIVLDYSSVNISGELLGLGSYDEENVSLYFNYRKYGDSEWIESEVLYATEPIVYNYTTSELKVDDIYEYKFMLNYSEGTIEGELSNFTINGNYTYNETEYCYDNSYTYENLIDGIYEVEAITCTNESLCNSTEVRTFYVDTTYPLIEYAPNSDLTNITGNFTDKDWIFVNVTYTEINEANVTFTLMDQTGDLQVITFDNFPTIWEQDNDSISYNFTDLDDSMYFYAVRICDLSNNCNTTEVQYYGVETTNLTLDFNYTDLDLELGSPIMINATNNLGQVCVDVDHPNYGDNYSCGTYKTGFELVIDYFRKKLFSNGEEYQEFTFTGEENKSYNLTSHKYDTLDNLSFNILGDATLLRFYNYASGIIERGFFGSLIGDRIYLNETIEINETTFVPFLTPENNLTFTTSGVSSVYLLMDDSAKDINLSFDVYGEEFGLEYENYLNSTAKVSDTDFDLTTARVGGGFIVPSGTNPMNFTYDDFTDALVNETLWDFFQTNGHYSVSGWGLDITNGESIGKIYLNALASEGSGDDTFTFQDFLSANYTYLNPYSTDNIKITLSYSGFGENKNNYGYCNVKNKIYFGIEEVWTSSHEKVCKYIRTDGSYGSCFDYFITDDNLNISLIKNLNNSWTLSLEGTERVYGTYRDRKKGWNCGTKTRLYNWTEGILYVTHSITVDPECQNYNESIENSYLITDFNYSNSIIQFSHYLNGKFFHSYNDGCRRMSNNLEIKNITQTLYNITNSSYYTISLLDTQGLISQSESSIVHIDNGEDVVNMYLSSDNGVNWENVNNGVTHVFTNKGTNLKARYDFVLEEGGYRTDLPFINYFNVSTPKGYPTNLSFMLGDTIYATINGELNETNSPQTIIIENPNTTNMFRGQTFQSTNEPFNHLYDVPLRIFSDSTGFVTVNNYNLTYDPNPIILNVSDMQEYLYDSEDDWNIFELIVKGQNGYLNITDLEFDYAGGNYTIPITAHNDLYTRTVTRFVNYFFTMWDYVFGNPTINYLEFIPLSPTSKNVSAHGQSNTVPIINLTHLGYYEGKNASISLKLDSEQDDACVNLTISKTNNKSEGFLLNTTWQEFETNVSYLDNTPIWMWADYQCNYFNWRLWQPNFYVRYCCDGCVCSEEV